MKISVKKALVKLTPEQKLEALEHRREVFCSKRANAMNSLSAKVAALGDDALLDEFEFAAFISKSVQWVRNRRVYGGSLPFKRIGAAVRYRLGDIKDAIGG